MLNNLSKIGVSLMLTLSISHAVTKSEVKNFVENGATLCKEKGNEACFSEFNNPKGDFIKGELYMFAYDYNGINYALGSNPMVVGKNLYRIKDGTGLFIVQEFIEISKNKGSGWLDYKWSHPQTKRLTPKISYIKSIDGNMLIGAGVYK